MPDMGTETIRFCALQIDAFVHDALLWLMPVEEE